MHDDTTVPSTGAADRPVGVLVIGNGMVGHRFVEEAVARGLHERGGIVVVGEERHRAYDRVHLSAVFDGRDVASLTLGDDDLYRQPGVELVLGDPVVELDVAARRAVTASG